MLNSTDLSAKLLATENVNVVRARARTASFDIKSRTLTLPQWKDMTPEIEGMLVGHEVGHALYTDMSYIKPMETNRKLHSYLNVIEDVRIEKLMKRKYPGIRKTMTEGYKQLNDRDFFGIKSVQDMSTLILIDRINLYFKAGFACGVTFTTEEKEFVVRAEKTETVDDVIQLAEEIYEHTKKSLEERKKQITLSLPDDIRLEDSDEDDDEDDQDDMFDDLDIDIGDEAIPEDGEEVRRERGNSGYNNEKHDEVTQEELESKTDRAFSKKLEDLADENTEYNYYDIVDTYQFDPMVSYKTILSETISVEEDLSTDHHDMVAKFKQETVRSVNYLVKEFEMRKSAQMYKRSQVSKSGSLNMSKVYAYKLSDDIFKRITTIPEGKNHGMIFLLDWSGSMDMVIEDTIKQVINLAMFCQRAQIPYQVLAFSSQYDKEHNYEAVSAKRHGIFSEDKPLIDNCDGRFALLELFSSKMSNSEFNTMIRRTTSRYFFRAKHGAYSTGGTPLNEAIMYMLNTHLQKFIKNNNIEKMTLITLTDGEGGTLNSNKGYFDDRRNIYDGGRYVRVARKHFIRDPYTKKTYEVGKQSSVHTATLLSMIKDRFGISVLGFFICGNSKRHLQSAVSSNIPNFNGDVWMMIEGMRREFREKGFASLKNTGRDDLFIIPLSSTKISDDEMVADGDMSAAAIAKKLSKFMGNKKTSRVLLNNFIGYVA